MNIFKRIKQRKLARQAAANERAGRELVVFCANVLNVSEEELGRRLNRNMQALDACRMTPEEAREITNRLMCPRR